MIICGSRGMTSTKGSGTFHCPNCNDRRPYGLRGVKRWFTLYFIPIFPISGTVGEFVECNGCRGQFDKRVLSNDPENQKRQLAAGMAMAATALLVQGAEAAGRLKGASPTALAAAVAQATGMEPPQGLVEKMMELAAKDPRGHLVAINAVIGGINEQGKEMLYKSALAGVLFNTEGEMSERATRYLEEVASAMQMSAAHVRGILAGG